MSTTATNPNRERVLVLLPSAGEAHVARTVLAEAGLSCQECTDIEELCQRLDEGAAAGILAEEALVPQQTLLLVECLHRQPPWSDLPLLVLLNASSQEAGNALRLLNLVEPLGNVNVLERPVRALTLVSAIRAAVRERQCQYRLAALLRLLDEKVHDWDQLLAWLTHKLRTPLNTILASTAILEQVGSRASVAIEQRAIITRQTHTLAHLLGSVEEAFRASAENVFLERKVLDLGALAQRCLNKAKGALKAQQQLTFTTAGGPFPVQGDAARLEEVFEKLLVNAIEHTPPGGRIELALCQQEGQVAVKVRDTGEGIAAERLPQVFQLLRPGALPEKWPQGSLGLDLFQVRRLTELHGGSVAAASPGPGKGSEFIVRLPLAPGAPRVPTTAVPTGGNVQRQRILVVEDDSEARHALALLLRLKGHEVEVAGDGPEGLQKSLSFRPQVVLLDIGLPGMDGCQVARQLRQTLGHTVHLIALTGFGRAGDRQRVQEAGFDACLIKPVHAAELCAVLTGGRPGEQ